MDGAKLSGFAFLDEIEELKDLAEEVVAVIVQVMDNQSAKLVSGLRVRVLVLFLGGKGVMPSRASCQGWSKNLSMRSLT